MKQNIKVVGFDADDTLWINEPYFQETENKFVELLKPHIAESAIKKELFETEMKNLDIYGYGIKSFILSMVETALQLSQNAIKTDEIEQIIEYGKEMLQHPVYLLPGVEDVLKYLHPRYRLILVTKGDLLDQERKLKKSGLAGYFHHIEIMSDKTEENYLKLLKHLDIKATEFAMIGNSMKSDVLPVFNTGATAFFVPYSATWEHEEVENHISDERIVNIQNITEVMNIL